MQTTPIDRERALARAALAKINIGIIAAAGARRQGHGDRHAGARAPAGLGAAPVGLHTLEDRRPDPSGDGAADRERPARPDELVTPLGHKTALRRVPRALARLGRRDARYLAALAYLDARERIGAVAGQNMQSSGGGGISDGGAVARTEIAALLRRIEAAINGRKWQGKSADALAFAEANAAPLFVLKASRKRRDLKPITARALVDGIIIEGLTAKDILAAHGWSVQSCYVKRLNALFLELLEVMIDPIAAGGHRRARWD